MPAMDKKSALKAKERELLLTKPPGSLGKLEEIVEWLVSWQGRYPGKLENIKIAIFAGNHGVADRGVSAYPAEVTAQMVENFNKGGAAINQLANMIGAELEVIPLDLDTPVNDFTKAPAMDEKEFLSAFCKGMGVVDICTDLLCLGEMGIANTTAASALSASLFGGDPNDWIGTGTGLDNEGLKRKREVVSIGIKKHRIIKNNPIELMSCFSGREFAAILGAVVAARFCKVPTILDGFTCTAAASPIHLISAGGLDHCQIAHLSQEPGHKKLLHALGRDALIDFEMRLGEGTGAALSANLIRAALQIHSGMATFSSAGISGPKD
tara:strand:- start:50404 stop:51375 length:972 start_codon:yes stop_codon:yes gene_type:complete